jgi:hypothetical protein
MILKPHFFNGNAVDVLPEIAFWSQYHVGQVVSVQVLHQASKNNDWTQIVVWYWGEPEGKPIGSEPAPMAEDLGEPWAGPMNTMLD